VGPTRIISVIGRKNAGKTTLVVALVSELAREGRRVATIKHGHHPALVDTEGTDTWRHYHEGHARRVLIESPGERVVFERTESDGDPEALARQYMAGMDIVIAEGFKQSALPKIEVHRKSIHPHPLFDPASPAAGLWVAMVTDDPALRPPCPVFRFSDTAWLVTLSGLAWSRAKLLEP
jgi:molybdopterin-guanine dinucleotide biosynthesis protein MobB